MEQITPEVIAAHNLTTEEFDRIKSLLGRAPTFVELGIFSVMWSEHCSYKSSRIHLKRLPTTGERIVVAAADPLNLSGILTIGPRIPALAGNRVVFCDGTYEPYTANRVEKAAPA